jgi:hypothetical protein
MVAVSRLLVAVAVLVHTCCVVRKSYGQQLKSRDQSTYQLQSQHPEIFYDTRVIPDGAEVTSYLLNNETTRYISSSNVVMSFAFIFADNRVKRVIETAEVGILVLLLSLNQIRQLLSWTMVQAGSSISC